MTPTASAGAPSSAAENPYCAILPEPSSLKPPRAGGTVNGKLMLQRMLRAGGREVNPSYIRENAWLTRSLGLVGCDALTRGERAQENGAA